MCFRNHQIKFLKVKLMFVYWSARRSSCGVFSAGGLEFNLRSTGWTQIKRMRWRCSLDCRGFFSFSGGRLWTERWIITDFIRFKSSSLKAAITAAVQSLRRRDKNRVRNLAKRGFLGKLQRSDGLSRSWTCDSRPEKAASDGFYSYFYNDFGRNCDP